MPVLSLTLRLSAGSVSGNPPAAARPDVGTVQYAAHAEMEARFYYGPPPVRGRVVAGEMSSNCSFIEKWE